MDDEHYCSGEVGDTECHDGELYGNCGHESCYGGCDWIGSCGCACHEEKSPSE